MSEEERELLLLIADLLKNTLADAGRVVDLEDLNIAVHRVESSLPASEGIS